MTDIIKDPTVAADGGAPADNPYELSDERFERLQQELLDRAKEATSLETIHAVWMATDDQFADLARTLEKRQFPEMDEVMASFEDQSTFMVLADNRPSVNRIIHVFRNTSLELAGLEFAKEAGTTGVGLIDDMIQSSQGLTAEEVELYYGERGVDLTKCVSVETNFRVGEKVESETGLATPDIGYIGLFRAIKRLSTDIEKATVFTHLSHPSFESMKRVGVEYGSIAGRADLRTPTVKNGVVGFDDHYTPIEIPASPHNIQLFEDLMPFAAPEVLLSRE